MKVTTKSTRMAGTARNRIASSGAFAACASRPGGVAGSVNENAASANEANPATTKMLESAASSASPVLPARMKTNGQLAAIHPIVPQSRMRPKSFRASCTW